MPATVKRPPITAEHRVKKESTVPRLRSVFLTLSGVSSKVKEMLRTKCATAQIKGRHERWWFSAGCTTHLGSTVLSAVSAL